jgi:hypothetical protein
VDDWLRTTESKFGLLHCTEYQQLRGLVGAWWASYLTAPPTDHHVAWGEFHIAFRGHHLSASTICRKLAEFLELCQGNHSVYDYNQEFNNLVEYGGIMWTVMLRRMSSTARGSIISRKTA